MRLRRASVCRSPGVRFDEEWEEPVHWDMWPDPANGPSLAWIQERLKRHHWNETPKVERVYHGSGAKGSVIHIFVKKQTARMHRGPKNEFVSALCGRPIFGDAVFVGGPVYVNEPRPDEVPPDGDLWEAVE